MLLSILIVSISSVRQTNGLPICSPRTSLIQPSRELIRKVAFYDGIRPIDAKAFAAQKGLTQAEVESRFGATGIFKCENAAGNGQIVAKRNTLVTVFHTLLKDRESCNKPRDLGRCAFLFKEGSKTVTIYAKRIIASGECKLGEQLDVGDDWAIIELEKNLPSRVVPYAVPRDEGLQPGRAVNVVGRTSAFNPDSTIGDMIDHPQSFSSCTAIRKDSFKFFKAYQANCPTADGSSGSAILSDDSRPILEGLMSGGMKTRELCVPNEHPSEEDGPFQSNCRGSLLVPVEGKFLSALRALK